MQQSATTIQSSYPAEFFQRILAQEAPGGPPVRLQVVIPSITIPGEPFVVKITVLDADGYPSLCCEGDVRVTMPGSNAEPAHITFRAGEPAVGCISGLIITAPGFYRLNAALAELSTISNPTLCETAPSHLIYWGDPHVHTTISNCHPNYARSLPFCFTAAQYASGLDWVTAADHVSNGRSDFSRWKLSAAIAEHYHQPGEFVTLPGYEASFKGGSGGDNNVYMSRFPEMFVEDYDEGNVLTLRNRLAEQLSPGEFFIVPHHPTRPGKHGEIPDTIYPGAESMPLLEIYSKWGASEFRGNPVPLNEVHTGPSYAVDLLRRGLRLGFIAGTDTHATMPAGYGVEPSEHLTALPGMTAVSARTLRREAIFQGLQSRACYAASGERTILRVQLNSLSQGMLCRWSDTRRPRTISVIVAGQSDICSIELIRNGESIQQIHPQSWHWTGDFIDDTPLHTHSLPSPHLGNFVFYYIRITCASGARAWSSPIWLLEDEKLEQLTTTAEMRST